MKVREFSLVVLSIFGAAACWISTASAEQFVVMQSNSPVYPLGKLLDGDSALDIPAGKRVVIVSDSGLANAIDGPFRGPPLHARSVEKGQATALLSGLLSLGGVDTTSTAVYRDLIAPTISDIIIEAGGDQCILADGTVYLYMRHEGASPSDVLLKIAKHGSSPVELSLAKQRTEWPAILPRTDGGRYDFSLSVDGNMIKDGSFVLHIIPVGLPTEAHKFAQVAAYHCDRQALVILSTLVP